MTTMIPFADMTPEQRRKAEKEHRLPAGYLDQPRFRRSTKKKDERNA